MYRWKGLLIRLHHRSEIKVHYKSHMVVTFDSVRVKTLPIYELFMVAVICVLHSDTPCTKSQHGFFSFTCVTWLLIPCSEQPFLHLYHYRIDETVCFTFLLWPMKTLIIKSRHLWDVRVVIVKLMTSSIARSGDSLFQSVVFVSKLS